MSAALRTIDFDRRVSPVKFVVQLFDAFTETSVPIGELTAQLVPELKGKRVGPVRKNPDATFLCLELPSGDYTLQVRSNAEARPPTPPYYAPLTFSFSVLPLPPAGAEPPLVDPAAPPVWPGVPNISLANRELPLDHPKQPAAYRESRELAALRPTAAYPFPPGATLVRGTVLDKADQPVAGATVTGPGEGQFYLTEADGQFVIFLLTFPTDVKPPTIQLKAVKAGLSTSKTIQVRRGMTTAANLKFT